MRKSIFVSSTFRDFQRERDLLQTKVELRVNELLQPSRVSFLDLRWGIDTTGEKNLEKVVSICIEEVLNSHPFYVIMLGDTYGSCVDSAVVRSLYAINGLSYDAGEKSVTQIEIEATGLFDGNRDYVLVLDRQSDGPVDPRAAALKRRVLEAADPENIYTYTVQGSDNEIILRDEDGWVEFIAGRIYTFLKDQTTSAEHYTVARAKDTARQFRGREALLQKLYKAVTTFDAESFFRIYAPRGSGLTALLSKLYVKLQEDGAQVAFCEAASELPVSFYEMLNSVGAQWGLATDMDSDVFSNLDPEKRYFCILENLDEIEADPRLQRLLRRGQIPPNILFILAVSDSSRADFTVDYPTKEDALALFDGTMQEYRKELPQSFRRYFEEHIPEEMVRQPVFLKEFISELCYLTEAEYKALGNSDSFMEALVTLFTAKLDRFPANEQEYIQTVLRDSPESQIWLLGLLSVAGGSLDGKVLLGILRSGGIECDMLTLRIVKERFRDSIYCFEGSLYAISRDSFRDAVRRCFTPEQLRWLRYLLIAYVGQNSALLKIPQNFQSVAAQYLVLEDYELLARLLELEYLIGDEHEENGVRFAQMCNEIGADEPSRHYRALATQNNAYCCRWLVDYAMPHLTELYIQNATDMFSQIYETVAAEGKDDNTTADILGLLTFGMGLQLRGREAQRLSVQEMKKVISGNGVAQSYLMACLRLDTGPAGRMIDFLLELTDPSNEAIGAVLGRFLRYTVLMDGNMCSYKSQLERLFVHCEKFISTCDRSDNVSIAVPLLFLSSLLKAPLENPEAVEETVRKGSLAEQPLSVHMLSLYHRYMSQGDESLWQELIDLVCTTLDDEVPLSTVDLFYVSRYLRRICYYTPTALEPAEAAAYIKMLYSRFLELDNTEMYLNKVIEMFYLGGLMCIYEGAQQGLALLGSILSDTRVLTKDLLSELNFFEQDAKKLINITKSTAAIKELEAALQKRQ